MRSIYIRSLLIVAGLVAYLAIETLAPRGIDGAPVASPALGTTAAPA